MLVWVPEPVCQTSSGKCSSSLPSAMSCATATIAVARRRSSEPRSRLTSAAARLIRPSARTISIGMRSLPMRKLCSERSVCAPQSLSAGIASGPKASLSMRVFWRVLRLLGHAECKPVAAGEGRVISSCGSGRGGPLRRRPAGLSGFGSACRRGVARPAAWRGRRRRAEVGVCALFLDRLSCLCALAGVCRSSPSVTSSNCRPNCTDGSKKPLIASNGMPSFSGMPPNDRPTSKPRSLTVRSQNWCCRMMVISLRILRAQPVGHAHALGAWCRTRCRNDGRPAGLSWRPR